jgi:hypothetical protein
MVLLQWRLVSPLQIGFRAVSGHRKDIYAKNLVKTTKLPMRGINERI